MTNITATAEITLDRELVYQDVTTGSSPWSAIVDLTIPSGAQVTGSGAIVTAIKVDGVMTPVDSLDAATVASFTNYLRVFSGPHPSNSGLWRVMLSQASGNPTVAVRAWMTTLGPATS